MSDSEIENEFSSILYKLEMSGKWLSQQDRDRQEQVTKDLAMKTQGEFI